MNQSIIDDWICSLPPSGPCQSFKPGHQVHWIMWKLFRTAPRKRAFVRELDGTAITLQIDGRTHVWHHHEPARVAAMLVDDTRSVTAIEDCTTLVIGGANPTWLYCSAHRLEPCRFLEHLHRRDPY